MAFSYSIRGTLFLGQELETGSTRNVTVKGSATDIGIAFNLKGAGKLTSSGSVITGSRAADGTGANGEIYYNTVTNKFRGYQNGGWVDVVGAGFTNQVANTFFSGPSSGADAAPTFRALSELDLPRNQVVVSATTYTMLAANVGKVHYFTSASGCVVTLPNSLVNNYEALLIRAAGAGLITVQATTTLVSSGSLNTLESDGAWCAITHKGSNIWYISGELGAASGGSGVTDGDKGDITVSSSGAIWTIDNDVISFAKMQNSAGAGLSVVGRSANSAGDFAEINAASDYQILRRSGTAIAFGAIDISQSNAVGSSVLNIANGGTALSALGTAGQILRVNSGATAYEFFTPALVSDGDKGDIVVSSSGTTWLLDSNVVLDTKLRMSTGLTVIGRSVSTTGNVADISSTGDNTILRTSGTTLGFGSINLSQTNAVGISVLNPLNGGTGIGTAPGANRILGFNAANSACEYKVVSNGMTSASGTLKWGGALTADTSISGNFTLRLGVFGGSLLNLISLATSNGASISVTGTGSPLSVAQTAPASNTGQTVLLYLSRAFSTTPTTGQQYPSAIIFQSQNNAGAPDNILQFITRYESNISGAVYSSLSTRLVKNSLEVEVFNINAQIDNRAQFFGPVLLKDYTTAGLPDPTAHDFSIVYDTDDSTIKFSDGTSWITPGAGGVPDGDKGDITVSSSGAVWTIDNSVITYAKIQNAAAGLSILARSANTSGVYAEVTAGTDGFVLRRSGTTLGFGTIATAGIANDAITYAKMQNITTGRVLGRTTASSGDIEELTSLVLGNTGDSGSRTISIVSSTAAAGLALAMQGDGVFSVSTGSAGRSDMYVNQINVGPGGGSVSTTHCVTIQGNSGTARIIHFRVDPAYASIPLEVEASTGLFNSVDGGTLNLLGGAAYTTTGNGNGGSILIRSGGRRVAGSGVDGNVTIDVGNGRLLFQGLPTSSAGLTTGMIWNNSGVLTIV